MVKNTIDHYISNLLYYNECVVVPGFGAFLTRYYPAEINSATHMFRPPSKRVAFNARIQENDGLLAKHIASTDQVNFAKAMESIDISVRSWKKLLRAGKKVNLNGIGRLYMSDTGKLQFNPAHDINYDINSYGLNIFRANAMERDLEIKRSVNKAIEKHQTKKVRQTPVKEKEPVVRDINYRRWVAILGPVAASLLVGAYLYTNPGSFNTVQQQVSGIFLTDSTFQEDDSDNTSSLLANESSIGFSEGERLNGDFGPEDDVVSEQKEEMEIADPIVSDEDAMDNVMDDSKVTITEEQTSQDTPDLEDEIVSSDNELDNANEEPVIESENTALSSPSSRSNKIEPNFYLPEKPLYHVKERPEGYVEPEYDESTSFQSGYSFSSELNPEKQEETRKASPSDRSKTPTNTVKKEAKQSRPAQNSSASTASSGSTTSTTSTVKTKKQSIQSEGGVYQIVVGAFSSEANASRYVKKLQSEGWVAYSYQSGSLHRVAIGKLNQREKAQNLLSQVKQQVNAGAWVNLQ